MSKHTPGPWEQRGKRVYATGSVDTFSGPVIGAIAYCEETTQTDCEGRTWAVNGDALANARLIAAAPDMLEALRPFAEVDYEELIGAPDDMPIEEALRKAGQPTVGDLRRAMDAIAKAEGRS